MAEYFIQTMGLPGWLTWSLLAVLSAVLILNLMAGGALVFIWAERKVSARIQDRLGPTRTGGRFGWLQSLADGIKLLAKEDLMPERADKMLFRVAPYVSFCASFAAFISLPFAFDMVALRLNVGVFYVVAVLGLEVFGVILAGYASASKWSLFGAMREAAQVVSYEVPLGMCIVVPVMLAGTMDLVTIAEKQSGWFTNWYLFHDPFTFVVFWVYTTCAVASVNRAPFDLAEAESELVAGFHTEYSGLRWSFFYMAEYSSMFLVSGLAAILFLGGWNGPVPIASLLGLSEGSGESTGAFVRLVGLANLLGKATLGVLFMMWIRWTLPRLRIDQVMTTCLKYCTPIAAVMFAGAMTWLWVFPGGVLNLNDGSRRPGEIREGWLEGPGGRRAAVTDAPVEDPPVLAEIAEVST
ncbi:MAG: NADH-quinone oxidoreductase subunit NuoH [Planctomycetota bacterium]|nr:NADH-quinone oxidoreductase subunit NuoH [Planctomycetota bacterium]